MPEVFSDREYYDMHLIYGFTKGYVLTAYIGSRFEIP